MPVLIPEEIARELPTINFTEFHSNRTSFLKKLFMMITENRYLKRKFIIEVAAQYIMLQADEFDFEWLKRDIAFRFALVANILLSEGS